MIKVEIERKNAETLLEALQRRLEVIHRAENNRPDGMSTTLQEERAALVPTIIAIEQALKRPACC